VIDKEQNLFLVGIEAGSSRPRAPVNSMTDEDSYDDDYFYMPHMVEGVNRLPQGLCSHSLKANHYIGD
jgi:hypothetical protein